MQPGLRVLAIVDHLQPAGAQRVVLDEARALRASNIRLEVAALARWPGNTIEPELASNGIRVHHVFGHGLRDVPRLGSLVQLIRDRQPDVVHTHLEYANVLGIIAARLAGRPAVATLHSVTNHQARHAGPKRALESVVLSRMAERVIVVARGVLEETCRNFRLPTGRVVSLPNGIDLERLQSAAGFDRDEQRRRLGARPNGRLVCVVARLEPVKGHRFLLPALSTLASRHPETRYLLVGTGSHERRLRAQAAELGLTDHVRFLGQRADVPAIVAASDLFVLPSLREGLSLAVLEALALGTPVVATDVGGTRDVVIPGRTGWLVPPADSSALVAAIDEALKAPLRLTLYGQRASALVRDEFSLDVHAARLGAIYRSVVPGASARRVAASRWPAGVSLVGTTWAEALSSTPELAGTVSVMLPMLA